MAHSIDLRSDTVTRPSEAMRAAMAGAEVGDDVYGEDPSVNRLQELAAELTGKQAALFVPSGTMANQIAVRVWTEPGDALIAARDAHVHLYEGGGAAALSGVQSVLVGEEGFYDLEDVKAAAAPDDIHFARTRLVCLENTHNRSGGRVFPIREALAVGEWVHEQGWAFHLDGARIFNASEASGRAVSELAGPFDSVSFCLSKGLGAPVGSLICGNEEFVGRALRVRKLLGGGMRQAGILAAAGLYALENNVERLAEDHQKARSFATGLAERSEIRMVRAPETNIVVFESDDVPGLWAGAREREVHLSQMDSRTLRAVLHKDVSAREVETAVGRIHEVLDELSG